MSLKSLLLASATLTASVGVAAPVLAQPASTAIEEIVVTAQRRAESLQNVPIAVTAVQGAVLAARGISSTSDLAAITPGLTTTTSLSRATPFIRGIGSAAADPGMESGVATYVDGVYYSSPQGNVFSLNNIERIEVLKGPQGTLFGRNATGGLIHIITRDPSATSMVKGSIGYGNYDTVDGSLYATTGLTENLAADLSLFGTHQGDGWGRNLTTGQNINVRREWSARTKFKWTPDDLTSVTISADYQRNYTDLGTNRNTNPGGRLSGNFPFRGTIYDAQGNVMNFVHQINWGASVKVNRELSFGDFQSLTAYRWNKGLTLYDQDSSPLSIVDTNLNEHQKSFQQEFLLTGGTDRLQWTTGVFYYEADADLVLSVRSGTVASLRYDQPANMRTRSIAGFAQGAYKLADETTLTLGARYTKDHRRIRGERRAAAGNVTGTPRPAGSVIQSSVGDAIPDSRSFGKLTYRIALDHRLSDAALVYASYSRGFKGGTYTLTNPFPAAVRPETIDAQEIGIKSDLFDNRVRLNVAGFHYTHKDIQLSQSQAGQTILLNAAQGRVWGADAEFTAIAYDDVGRLEITAGASVLDAVYNRFPNAPILRANPTGGNTQVPCPLPDTPACSASGNRIIKTPKFTANLGLNYAVTIGEMKVSADALYYHSGKFYWEADNRIPQESYDTLNLQLTVGTADDRWQVRGYVRNVFDKAYYQAHGISTLGDVFIPAPPRTYGVALNFRFGG